MSPSLMILMALDCVDIQRTSAIHQCDRWRTKSGEVVIKVQKNKGYFSRQILQVLKLASSTFKNKTKPGRIFHIIGHQHHAKPS